MNKYIYGVFPTGDDSTGVCPTGDDSTGACVQIVQKLAPA